MTESTDKLKQRAYQSVRTAISNGALVRPDACPAPEGSSMSEKALAAAPEAAQGEADELAALRAEVERLRADYAKAERRAIAFGDIISNQCIAMQAAVIEQHAGGGAESAMCWIANTLRGPGLLPDIDEAIELAGDGGQDRAAQAWFDAKTAEHEAFRAAHPGPAPDAALRQEKKG